MGKIERLIIYTLLAVMAVATFSNRGLTQAKDKPGEATFNKIIIVDEKGETRAILGMLKEGPGLVLNDEAGKPRAVLGVDKDEPGLALLDEAGKGRAVLAAVKEGAGLTLLDEKGKLRAVLRSTSLETTATGTQIKTSPASLALFDKEGKVIWKAPLTD